MKTKYINVLFSFVIASFMMSCSSEIPTGDANKFSDMKSPEEDMVKRDYCLLYTSDAADELLCVDLGGRGVIKKKKKKTVECYSGYQLY